MNNKITIVSFAVLVAIVVATVAPWLRSSEEREVKPFDFPAVTLEERCIGYSMSLEDARRVIRDEFENQAMYLATNDLNKWRESRSSATSLIESARLCGGYSVEMLELTAGHLLILGMIKG